MKTLKSDRIRRPRERFLPLPVDRHVELTFEFPETIDLAVFDSNVVVGARVKPIVIVSEEKLETLDREAIRRAILEKGAVHCRAPEVRVVRRKVKRDERHAADVPLEESLRIFAEETRARNAEWKVGFAAELAREADAGARE